MTKKFNEKLLARVELRAEDLCRIMSACQAMAVGLAKTADSMKDLEEAMALQRIALQFRNMLEVVEGAEEAEEVKEAKITCRDSVVDGN